ncbi:hypothetical protein THAOC_05095, partial [Thalassiosira oceanica]
PKLLQRELDDMEGIRLRRREADGRPQSPDSGVNGQAGKARLSDAPEAAGGARLVERLDIAQRTFHNHVVAAPILQSGPDLLSSWDNGATGLGVIMEPTVQQIDVDQCRSMPTRRRIKLAPLHRMRNILDASGRANPFAAGNDCANIAFSQAWDQKQHNKRQQTRHPAFQECEQDQTHHHLPQRNITWGCQFYSGLTMPAMKDEVDRSSLLSLRQWITVEGPNSRDAVLRKTAVARGLALILRHIARTGIGRYGQNDKHVDPIFAALHQHVLGLKSRSLADDAHVDNFTLEIIDGRPVVLSCVSPSVNLVLEAGDTENAILPRHESLESWTIDLRTSPTDVSHPPTTGMSNEDSDALLTKLGDLLYKLYSGNPNLCATTAKEVNPIAFQRLNVDDDVVGGHHRQKRRSTAVTMLGQFGERHAQLKDLGVPDVTACLVRDLLEVSLGDFRPDTSVASIEEVCEELQLMHEKSGIFMFASPIVEQPRLEIDTTVLYGREDEMSRLLSVHDRLRDTGESEAILIDGYSGCGKTSLARSVIPHVERAGGYFIGQKLDVLTSSPVALVLNAFDMLPPLVLKMCNPCEVESIKRDLCSIFGDQLASLVRLLPNAALLRTSTWSSPPSQLDGKLRVDYTLQLFARIISSRSRPIVLHLDDIQHTDQYSLDLLQHILCDIKGCSSILFVGSFRSNELGDEHPGNYDATLATLLSLSFLK